MRGRKRGTSCTDSPPPPPPAESSPSSSSSMLPLPTVVWSRGEAWWRWQRSASRWWRGGEGLEKAWKSRCCCCHHHRCCYGHCCCGRSGRRRHRKDFPRVKAGLHTRWSSPKLRRNQSTTKPQTHHCCHCCHCCCYFQQTEKTLPEKDLGWWHSQIVAVVASLFADHPLPPPVAAPRSTEVTSSLLSVALVERCTRACFQRGSLSRPPVQQSQWSL